MERVREATDFGDGAISLADISTDRIAVSNYAWVEEQPHLITEGIGTRSWPTEARDFVIMQFGHNDGGALDDTARARGTIRGQGRRARIFTIPS